MENFKMDDFTMPSELKVGDVVKGIVVQVEKNTIYLDVQSFTEGKMYLEHFTKDASITSFEGLVKVGDEIVFAKYSGAEFNHEGKKYLILAEHDVLAVIEK